MCASEPSPADFAFEDNWHGGFYELDILYGDPYDARLDAASIACWTFPGLTGPYLRRDEPAADQQIISLPPPADSSHETSTPQNGTEGSEEDTLAWWMSRLYGIAHIPGWPPLVCGCCGARWTDPYRDILLFYIPIGALSRANPKVGGFPFNADGGPRSLSWRKTVDDWLADLGRHIHTRAPFRQAIIGVEAVDGWLDLEPGEPFPAERGMGHLVPQNGELLYLPATS